MTSEFAADVATIRADVARVELDRDVVLLEGPQALEYLQGQCTQDVGGLQPGTPADAFLLEPTGKVDALVRVVRLDGDRVVVDSDGGAGETVRARLARFKLRSRFQMTDPGWSVLGLRGPASDNVLRAAIAAAGTPAPGSGCVLGLPWAWGGVVGIDLLGPDPQGWLTDALGADVPPPCPPRAWEAVRIMAGVPVSRRDLDEDAVPAETGLLDRCVSFTKGCYTGQELVARMDARGNHAVRHLRGLLVEDPGDALPDPAGLVGAELVLPERDRPVGRVTSAAWASEEGRVVALGTVHRSAAPGAQLEIATAGTHVLVVELPIV